MEDRPRACKSRFQFGQHVRRARGAPIAPELLEAHRKVMHLVCTNRAGDALQRVRRVLKRRRVVSGDSLAQGFEADLALGQKAGDDARYAVGAAGPLQLLQRQERREIDSGLHITV